MLPGFRFLLAAIALSTSVLIFGLGAAALLRAAHEQFASIPSRRGPPEAVFAQPVESVPTLALLREDAPPAVEPSDTTAATVESGKTATLNVENLASGDAAKSEASATEITPAAGAAPIQVPPEGTSDAPKMAAIADAPKAEAPLLQALKPDAPKSEATQSEVVASENAKPDTASPARDAAPAASEASPATVTPDANGTRAAALGDPAAVEKKPSVQTTNTKPDRSALRERKRAQRAKERRRRIAARARLARQATQQPSADPFGQATVTTRSR